MPSINIEMPTSEINKYLSAMDDTVRNKVVKYTVSNLARRATSAVKTSITTAYNISKKNVPIKQLLASDGINQLISGSNRDVNSAVFNPVQTATGVDIQIERGETKTINHAFLTTVGSGHDGAFQRKGAARLPIIEVHTVNIGKLLKTDWLKGIVNATITQYAQDDFIKKYNSFNK